MTFSSYSQEPKKCLWQEKRNEREGAERWKEEMRVGGKKGERKRRGGEGKDGEGRDWEGKKKQMFSLLGAPILLKHNYLLLWGEHGLASSLSY